jgi:hypothetical protein
MHHIKFERNWSSGYQKEVKNVQMLTDTIYHVCPPLEGKTATLRIINFTILVEAFLLYITIQFFLHMCGSREVDFENWSILGSFCATTKAPGGQGP